MKRYFPIAFAVILLVLGLGSVQATTVTLSDNNSSVVIDLTSQMGANHWLVDGTNQLYQQWYWFGIGDSPLASVDTLTLTNVINPVPTFLRAEYSGREFDIALQWALIGGNTGSGTSDLSEQVAIHNTSGQTLTLHFYMYSDFDLGGTPAGDTVDILSQGHQVVQTDGHSTISDTVLTSSPSHFEAAFFANTRNALNSGLPYTLNDVSHVGPGDATWAIQWDFVIAPGSSVTISADKNIAPVPEPMSLVLVGSGLLGLAAIGRRLRRK